MDQDIREALIFIIEQIQIMQDHQAQDAIMAVQAFRAFQSQRPENAAALEVWKSNAEDWIATRKVRENSVELARIIQKLKES